MLLVFALLSHVSQMINSPAGGGALNLFLVGMCPDFQTWGLLSKTGAWELIIYQIFKLFNENRGQFGASGAKNCQYFLKIFYFGVRILHLSFEWKLVNGLQLGVLWTTGEAWKGGLEGAQLHTSFFRWVPPPRLPWRVFKVSIKHLHSNNYHISESCHNLAAEWCKFILWFHKVVHNTKNVQVKLYNSPNQETFSTCNIISSNVKWQSLIKEKINYNRKYIFIKGTHSF